MTCILHPLPPPKKFHKNQAVKFEQKNSIEESRSQPKCAEEKDNSEDLLAEMFECECCPRGVKGKCHANTIEESADSDSSVKKEISPENDPEVMENNPQSDPEYIPEHEPKISRTIEKIVKCAECGHSFHSKKSCRYHILQSHPGKGRGFC